MITNSAATTTSHKGGVGRHGRSSGRDRALVPTLALATTAGFAAGALVTQTTVVPAWRSMEPTEFQSHFSTRGPALGATLFPIELASVGLLVKATVSAVKDCRPNRWRWLAAAGCMVGTVLLLPLHFAGANRAMLNEDFPPADVNAELGAWYAWNWLRTGLALAATGLAVSAHAAGRSAAR